ncbi:hypothetical protein GCM10023108_39750 [Saccharopolyspora hordei]
MVELDSWEGVRPGKLEALSRDAEAVAVRQAEGMDLFQYAAHGRLVTWFEPAIPDNRGGLEPDRFLSVMTEVSLEPGAERNTGAPGAVELVRRVFGVEVDEATVFEVPLTAGIVRDTAQTAPGPHRRGGGLRHRAACPLSLAPVARREAHRSGGRAVRGGCRGRRRRRPPRRRTGRRRH